MRSILVMGEPKVIMHYDQILEDFWNALAGHIKMHISHLEAEASTCEA